MSSDNAKPSPPPDESVAGQPTKKQTLFDKLIKTTAKVLRQSR